MKSSCIHYSNSFERFVGALRARANKSATATDGTRIPQNTEASAIKSTLARLLAIENISVQHENIPTAFFDLKTRSLHLPLWSSATGALYDMLVGHEVAHALFTPMEGWKSGIESLSADTGVSPETAKQYLNIVEDARIERLIQEKFRGLKADFVSAYKTLMERQFFGDLSKVQTMMFADRFNLYFKCGVHTGLCIQFNTAENVLLNRGATITEWTQVVALARDMIVYAQECAQNNKSIEITPNTTDDVSVGDEGSDSDDSENSTESVPSGETGEPSENRKANAESTDTTTGDENKDPETCTQKQKVTQPAEDNSTDINPVTNKSLENQLKTLADTNKSAPSKIIRFPVPTTDLQKIVVPFSKIISVLGATGFRSVMEKPIHIADYTSAAHTMATAFNRKQAADAFRRTTVAKTGVLDPLRMNQYRWSEDIFRKTTRVADGKNHGIVILLDWSGSMSRIMRSTIGQLFILTDFCRKVGVPFEVYGFTNVPWSPESVVENSTNTIKPPLYLDAELTLFNFFSSKMSKNEYETMKSALWNWDSMSQWDCRFRLNSTPTSGALYHVSSAVAEFQANTRVQITHTVVLTDGEPTDGFEFSLSRWAAVQGLNSDAVFRDTDMGRKLAVVMTDPQTGASYDVKRVYHSQNGTWYEYGNVRTREGSATQRSLQFSIDILRRRTGSKIHWIGLTRGKTIVPSSYRMTPEKNYNWKRDGFVRGDVLGWNSAVIVNADRFLRDADGELDSNTSKVVKDAQLRMDAARSKREILSAFVESQIATGSLRNVAAFVGEHLAEA